jgi:hypothetical protein
MPAICQFFGIVIRMFFNDHAPPHFHAEYHAFKAVIRIETLQVVEGRLPPRARALVLDWAAQHRAELMADCKRVVSHACLCGVRLGYNPVQAASR